MPTPSTVFTEMVTTTLRNRAKEVVDNVSNHNALFRMMKDKKKIQSVSGGTEITRALEYAENQTFQRFSGYDVLNIAASDVLTSAKYDWTQYAINVTASGRELRINSGKEQMIDLVKARFTNAKNTAANNMSVDIYSDGALSNQIGGLAHIIQDNGQGTVGGINSGTHTFWRNKFQEMAGTNTWSKSTIRGEMNALWLQTLRGKDKTDLIVFTHDIYSTYEESLQDLQRYGDVQTASAGFENLKYKTAVVIPDDNANFGTTAEIGYFLNTDYLYLVQHPQAKWTEDDQKRPVNQDAIVIPLYWMGQLLCTNRARQGKLIDIA